MIKDRTFTEPPIWYNWSIKSSLGGIAVKIRVAVIGCGSIAEHRHAPEYGARGDVEIVAFCDPAPQRAERLAERYGGKAFASWEDVLALDSVDAVSVCTSNSTHAEIAIRALAAGRHVLCEKPMATSLADARNMARTAAKCGRTLMIGHNQRFAPAHVKAKELLMGGALGRVLAFKTTFGHGGPEGWSADKGAGTWFFRKSAAAMGALGDLGVHKADLVRHLLGEEIDEVFAVTTTMDKKYENGTPVDVEDNAVCVLRARGGVTGTLCASWTYYGEEDNSTVLYCDKGILRIYASAEYPLILERRGGLRETFDVGAMQTNNSQTNSGVIDAFVESVKQGRKPPVSGEDGFEALSIALACLRSAKSDAIEPVEHYGDRRFSTLRTQRRPPAIAVHNLMMETSFLPPPKKPAARYCDETYPGFAAAKKAVPVDPNSRKWFLMELGGRQGGN